MKDGSLVTFKFWFLVVLGENGTEVFKKVFLAILILSSALKNSPRSSTFATVIPNSSLWCSLLRCNFEVEADEF